MYIFNHRRQINTVPRWRDSDNGAIPVPRPERLRVPGHRSLRPDADLHLRRRYHLLRPLQAEAEEEREGP